jgi:hypothetical protein
MAASISPVVIPGRTIEAANWWAPQTTSPACRISAISRGDRNVNRVIASRTLFGRTAGRSARPALRFAR